MPFDVPHRLFIAATALVLGSGCAKSPAAPKAPIPESAIGYVLPMGGGQSAKPPRGMFHANLVRNYERRDSLVRAMGHPTQPGNFVAKCVEESQPHASGNRFSLKCDWGTLEDITVLDKRSAEIVVELGCGGYGFARLKIVEADEKGDTESTLASYVLHGERGPEQVTQSFPLLDGGATFGAAEGATASNRPLNGATREKDQYTVWADGKHEHFGAIVSGLSLAAEFYERRRGDVGACRTLGARELL